MCVVYLLSPQTKLKCVGSRLEVEKEGKKLYSLLTDEVECVVQGRLAQITTPALYELMERGVSIFYVDGRGRQLGHLYGGDSWQRSIDRLVLKSLNLKQFRPSEFIHDEELGCRLTESARKNFIGIYETYMDKQNQAHEGLSPREWVALQIGEFAKEIFRRGKEAV